MGTTTGNPLADVGNHRLIDITPGRDTDSVISWLAERPHTWLDAITVDTLDMAATYRSGYRQFLPHATLVGQARPALPGPAVADQSM